MDDFAFPIGRCFIPNWTANLQSGKTTLAKCFAQQGRSYLTLDNQPTLAAAKTDPVAFFRGLDRAIIDEVQRAPAPGRGV